MTLRDSRTSGPCASFTVDLVKRDQGTPHNTFGVGVYAVRSGGCQPTDEVLSYLEVSEDDADAFDVLQFEAPLSLEAGERAVLCVTKADYGGIPANRADPAHDAWWWSDIVVVNSHAQCDEPDAGS